MQPGITIDLVTCVTRMHTYGDVANNRLFTRNPGASGEMSAYYTRNSEKNLNFVGGRRVLFFSLALDIGTSYQAAAVSPCTFSQE